MADPTTRGRFLWHELATRDNRAAIAFYTRVIGWKAEPWDKDRNYTILSYDGNQIGGVAGVRAGESTGWVSYIGTPDAHVTAWEAQRLGARVLSEPQHIPGVGTWARLQDPQGAEFSILQRETPRELKAEAPVGDFSWHELTTADHRAAFRFYQELFGWDRTGSADMGPPVGEYLMFGFGKQPLGGMYTAGAGMPGPAWLPYIRVRDARALSSAITGAGGKILTGPMEVPGGDWITMATDPQGVMFAIHATAKKAARPRPAARKPAKKPARTPARARRTVTKKKVTRTTARTAKRGKTTSSGRKKTGKSKRK